MNLSGENFRSVAETREFSFYTSFDINGQTGIGKFILSGENNKIQFSLNSGRLIDPEGNYVYSYKDGETLQISGDIGTSTYSYHIGGGESLDPFAYGLSKSDFKLQRIHYNTTGMEFGSVITEIRGTPPSYFLHFPDSFISSGYHTGYLVNNSNDLGFEALSAEIMGEFTGFWKVTEADKVIAPSSSGKIVVQDLSGAALYLEHNYNLSVNTNFGTIETGVSAIANPSDFKTVIFDVTKGSTGLLSSGMTNIYNAAGGGNIWTDDPIHDETSRKFNSYYLEYVAYSGETLSGDKPLYVSLEYISGPTGDFFSGPNGTVTAKGNHILLTGLNSGFDTFLGAAAGMQYTGSLTGKMIGAEYVIGSGYVTNSTNDRILLTGVGHTGSIISGYELATGQLFVYATGETEGAIMSGITGISDPFNVAGPDGNVGAPATGSGLLAEYYGGNWHYGTDYVITTGLLDGLFTGRDIVATDLGSKIYQEYITGTIDVLTSGGTAGTTWGAKLINSSLKAPSYPSSGVTGVTLHSGYWTGEVIASGLTYFSGDSNFTGLLTGYEKTFTGSFDVYTGTSGSFLTSGYYWGEGGNVGAEPYTGYKSTPEPYMMSSGEYGAAIGVEFSCTHDFSEMVALLTISGMDNNVYTEYLTGIR
jgi:hypothetical protein